MIQEYNCKKNIKVMVQGYFQDTKRSSLYIIDYDFESIKYRYSTKLYLEVLNIELALIYSALPPICVFIQDNTLIYTVHKVKEWFQDYSIKNVILQPLYSLDLNLIKYIQ